jgi:hypothetical protein
MRRRPATALPFAAEGVKVVIDPVVNDGVTEFHTRRKSLIRLLLGFCPLRNSATSLPPWFNQHLTEAMSGSDGGSGESAFDPIHSRGA